MKEGYYWIKLPEKDFPEIAEYRYGHFVLIGDIFARIPKKIKVLSKRIKYKPRKKK